MPTRVVVRAPNPPPPTTTTTSSSSPKSQNQSRNVRFSDDYYNENETTKSSSSSSPSSRLEGTDLSRYDISASHQLENYFICFACSVIDLVSYKAQTENYTDDFTDRFVLDWKEWGAYVVGIAGTVMTGVIMLVHFDKFFCPSVWMYVFRAGSKAELVVVLFMFVFYCGAAYICTSPYSLGEVVPNVYFSAWVALASTVKLLDRWIENAGKKTIEERLNKHERKTTIYWGLLIIFSSITFFSALEIYIRRNRGVNYFGIDPSHGVTWEVLLPLSASSVAIAIVGLVGNFCGIGKFQIKLLCCSFDLGWRQIESVLLLAEIGMFSYGVFSYIGTQNFVNRPSNPYFGMWGSLLISILAISASIKEHHFSLVSYSKEEGLRFFTCADPTDD